MADQLLLLQYLRSFAVAMGDSYDITEVSYGLSDQVTNALEVTGAGVSVADQEGKLRFVTATSQPVIEVEKAQEQTQEGPCYEAYATQSPVAISDLRGSEWTGYATTAIQNGLRAVIGYPLSRRKERLGAINVYDDGPRDWTDQDLDIVGVFASMATAYLVRVTELAETAQLASQLQHALDSRIVIEQAKGILANEYGVSVDEAFKLLRHHSRNNNIKLAQVADAVVNLGLRIPNHNR